MLFFDLDGTLLASGAVLRRRTVQAVRAAAAQGATVVLATGGFSARTHLIARALADRTPYGVWRVAHNGAAIWDPSGNLVYAVPTPTTAIHAVLATAGRSVWATFETVDRHGATHAYYAGRLRPDLVHLIWGPQLGEVALADARDGVHTGLEPRWDWRRARTVPHAAGVRVLGCWCIGSPAALAPLDALAPNQALCGARYLHWGKRLAQILDRPRVRLAGRDVGAIDASKGAAARWLCGHLGVAPADTAAFGDSDNDLDLLEFAGTAVAVANATPEAKRRAAVFAPSSDEDGVATILEQWIGR